MRSLIGKVIQIKTDDLKSVPENKQESSVVVFTETKNFSVEKQRRATFNIMNPKRVVFMGSSGNGDPTTRAEQREEELERRRRESVLATRAGTASVVTGSGSGDDDDGGGGGGNRTFGSLLKTFGMKILELSGLIAAFKLFSQPFQSLTRAFQTARSVGTTVVRGARSVGTALARAGRAVFDFLTEPRTARGVAEAAGRGARAGARGFMEMVRRTVSAGIDRASRFGAAARNVPSRLRDAAIAAKGAGVARFLAGASRAGKIARFGLGAARGIGSLGLSVLADYLIYESASQADKLKALLMKNNDALNSMNRGLDKKLEFAKIYDGVPAAEYHREQALAFAGVYPEMMRQTNDARAQQDPPLPPMTEEEFINSEFLEMAKYRYPTLNNPSTIEGSKFSDLVREHSRLARENTGTISSKDLMEIKRNIMHSKVGPPQRNRGGIVGSIASMFMPAGSAPLPQPRQQPPFQNMDDLRFQEAFEMQNPQFRRTPIIIQDNRAAPAQPNVLFRDSSTRPPAPDVHELSGFDEIGGNNSGHFIPID